MKLYDTFIYLTICEVSLPMVKKANYTTYGAFCRGLGRSLKRNDLSGIEKSNINIIFIRLDLYFKMSLEETGSYIYKYFTNNLFSKYEYSVRLTKEHFPFVGN